ncbi:RNA polymerase-associated protein CTR9 homolog [Drosophila nasuta]|uniref:RNA polymerase-associated protein CTR9 homolog n=1 Tax=Drosophila nasuta TaxID=42062 RepID=UPI00295F0AAC|nr:RNA polymerase-associated protein CTR9 homolog [Drosophila nasuta]
METSDSKGGTAIQKLIDSLIKKRANLKDWIQKARDFYRVRDLESFEELLENAITHGYKTYAGYKDDLLKIYTMLAGHFVRLISKSLGGPHSEWQAKLSSIVLAMDELKIGPTDAQFLLCRGFALMVTNTRLAEADQCFATVLQRIPHNVAALLGRSCLAYQRQDYRLALGHIKSVFYNFPQGPADVRVAMGHCFLKIGNFDSARRAFEVAVSSNGHSLNALLGIAHLKLRKRQQAATKDAVNLLCAAFEMDSQHPLVLTWLAAHFYYSHDYDKMKSAAGTAYRLTDSPQLKAQNCFQIARGLHVNRNYEDAFAFYRKAVTHSPAGYVLPYLGLAQMCIRLNRLDEAEVALRTLLRALPQQTQALRMLAALYAQREDPAAQDMAIQLFKKAQREDDYCSHLSLADIYQRKQLWQDAIDCYDKAMSTHRCLHSTHNLPINWLNNVAALQMHLNQPKAALRTLDKALAMRDDASQEHWQSSMLTLRFNRARVLEALHLDEQAAQSYTQLISEYPSYCDSYVRLGHMANKRNLINAFENDEVPDFDLPDEILDMLTQHLKNSKGCYMSIAVANLCVIKAQRLKAMGGGYH